MMCSSLFFYSLLKESRTEDEIDKFFAYALYEVIFTSKSGIYVLEVLDHKKKHHLRLSQYSYLRSSMVLEYICGNKEILFLARIEEMCEKSYQEVFVMSNEQSRASKTSRGCCNP